MHCASSAEAKLEHTENVPILVTCGGGAGVARPPDSGLLVTLPAELQQPFGPVALSVNLSVGSRSAVAQLKREVD